MADILIGNVKGPQGDTGATGAQGEQGDAATIAVGSVTTTAYGNNARVTNSGTEHEAVFDFVIPQGRPGEQTTKIDNLTIDAITEPSTQFPVPAVGDNGSTLFGKVSKWFSDMAALVATKLNASNVVNNLTTTASGYALDARQGKVLSDAKADKSNPVLTFDVGSSGSAELRGAGGTGAKTVSLVYNSGASGAGNVFYNMLDANGVFLPDYAQIMSLQTATIGVSAIAAGATASGTTRITTVSGASGYYAIPITTGWLSVTAASVSGNTLTATFLNATNGAHSGGATFLVMAYKT